MQKKYKSGSSLAKRRFRKLILIMRLSFLIFFIGTIQLSASVYSEKTTLDIELKNASMKKLFTEIKEQSEFTFVFNVNDIEALKKVDCNFQGSTIEEVLDHCFEKTNLSYEVRDKVVIIVPKKSSVVITDKPVEPPFQQRTITGSVTNADGEPVPGVSIIVHGTIIGTITDVNGNYSLDLPGDARILVFTFLGMKTVEETLGDRSTVDVILETDLYGLEEVIVIGYGTQVKEAVTGSVSTVNADVLEKIPTSNIIQKMQGRVTGVHIINDHRPGGDATIRIRGLGTINDNAPLYIVDNVPIIISNEVQNRAGLSQINPNDIASISVLKDASSTGIYGARGANGVIIITTKRGKPGKPKIDFTARYGINKYATKFDLLNTPEHAELQWLVAENTGSVPGNATYGFGPQPVIPDYILPAGLSEGDPAVNPALYRFTDPEYIIIRANKEGTDWWEEMTHIGPETDINLSISGGTESNTYALSVGYMNEQSIFKHSSFERYSIRSNTDTKFADWLTIGENFGLSVTEGQGDDHNENDERSYTIGSANCQPIIPVYDIMGNFAGNNAPNTGDASNPYAGLYRNQWVSRNNLRFIGDVNAQADIFEGLNFKTVVGLDYVGGRIKSPNLRNYEAAMSRVADELSMSSSSGIQWNWINTLNFNRSFSDMHKLGVLIGTEAVSNTHDNFGAARSGYFLTTMDYMVLGSGEGDQTNNGSGYKWTTFSYFGRLNYDLAGKYLAQATLRRDGSSRFGANERWGNFPAFSLGWRISKESFMAGTENWLGYFKLRFGWGQSGNDLIGNYNGFTTFGSNPSNSYYGLDGANTSSSAGFESIAFGNLDAKWETITTTNGGLDATFFDRLTLTFDLWQRITSDMLYPMDIPDVVGQANSPSVNIGEMKNTGFDISLSYNGSAAGGDFKYNIIANVSHYKNEIIKLSDNALETIWGWSTESVGFQTRAEVGTSFPEFYGYIVDGIFQTQPEVDAHPPAFGESGTYNAMGHFKYRDVNGDGVINVDDRTYIGSPHPDFVAGLNLEMEYKSIDLSAFFYSSYGNEMINDVRRWIDYNVYNGNRSHDRLYNSWGSPYLDNNEDATLAMADNNSNSMAPSDHFVEDASYLRLKNLQLGYTLPNSATTRLKISSLRVYLQAVNLFTITEYSGLDPEVRARSGRQGMNMGLDFGAWPGYRQFMVGINIGI